MLLLVGEGECEEDDSELDEAEEPSFVSSSGKVLVFS